MRLFYLLASAALALATSASVLVDLQSGIRPDGDLLQLYPWLMMDPRLPREHRPTLDYGFLLLVSFPILALYHQFVGRRWIGVATVCGLLLILLAPDVVWILVYASR